MLKKIAGITGLITAGLLIILFAGILYIVIFFPNVGFAPEISVNRTPQRIKRGEYLAVHIAGCIDCHSGRDESRFAAPFVEGTAGQGGNVFETEAGRIVAPNITPYGIGNWTDGELFRAITCGVTREGRPLFPLMPYLSFGKMDREDIYDIIAYIRSLPPIHHPVEKTHLNFPMNIIVHTMPKRSVPAQRPPLEDTLLYGKYMVLASGCDNCHSPKEKGRDIAGREFSGGFALPLPGGKFVHSANITPDKETGIGNWTESMFLQRFKVCLDSGYSHPVAPKDHQTKMPWTFFAGMRTTDLEAIYRYMQTIKPIRHKVLPFGGNISKKDR